MGESFPELVREQGTSLIWITHDLSVVAGLADDVAVMKATGEVKSLVEASAGWLNPSCTHKGTKIAARMGTVENDEPMLLR